MIRSEVSQGVIKKVDRKAVLLKGVSLRQYNLNRNPADVPDTTWKSKLSPFLESSMKIVIGGTPNSLNSQNFHLIHQKGWR
ncbi:hypothetical protein LOAG_08449 [Loa loa]|uniref:Uncharacterized protein n=1 Tax=Loa loa TaxID=7209 RepID=A0A1S0TTP7_LOALO|nr:hypothetical protein LOAG_08449 [Loa loa]EFO20042.2 hypothetical protein LOAG_08449 [Loa loa]